MVVHVPLYPVHCQWSDNGSSRTRPDLKVHERNIPRIFFACSIIAADILILGPVRPRSHKCRTLCAVTLLACQIFATTVAGCPLSPEQPI